MKNPQLKIKYNTNTKIESVVKEENKYTLSVNPILNHKFSGFGDKLMTYLFYLVLKRYISNIFIDINENNMMSFIEYDKNDKHIILENKIDKTFFIEYDNYYAGRGNNYYIKTNSILNSILEIMLIKFSKQFNVPNNICDKIKQEIKNTKYRIPVKYYDIPNIPSVDISIVSKTGRFTPYRNWPYFKELKEKLNKEKITYIDLIEKNIKNVECLNYIKKSKLYLGLDTGVSHYASSVASGKTLIIQSGYNYFDFWCFYDYDYINVNIECQKCFKRYGCPYDHKCMKDISVNMVYNKIIEKLNK
jgi:hypothetical protein